MDLLKDKGSVPQAGENSNPLVSSLYGLVEQLSAQTERSGEPHDFMDLMYDKGLVPASANDNSTSLEAA